MFYKQLSLQGDNDQILWSGAKNDELDEEPIEDHESQIYMDLGSTGSLFDTSL